MTGASRVIFVKECREALRDTRSAFAMIAFALLGPAVLWFVLGFLARTARAERDVRVRVERLEHAPGLEAALLQAGITIADSAEIRVAVSPGFRAELRGDGDATITIVADLSRHTAQVARVRGALQALVENVAGQRLIARGVPPSITHPVRIDVQDRGGGAAATRLVLGAVVFVVLVAPFFGGIAIAADATAGERERHALALLLQQPIEAWEVAIGKWGAVAAAGLASLVGTIAGTGVVMWRLGDSLDALAAASLSIERGVLLTIALVPLCLTVAALQMLVALASRTYKEAQSYLNLLSLLPFVVLLLSQLAGRRVASSAPLPVPVVWESETINALLTGAALPWRSTAWALAIHAVTIMLLLGASAWQLRRVARRDD